MSKYIEFVKNDVKSKGKKTAVWNIFSLKNAYFLGEIRWYAPWRQYCFFPQADTLYNRTCMRDIENFMEDLMILRDVIKK